MRFLLEHVLRFLLAHRHVEQMFGRRERGALGSWFVFAVILLLITWPNRCLESLEAILGVDIIVILQLPKASAIALTLRRRYLRVQVRHGRADRGDALRHLDVDEAVERDAGRASIIVRRNQRAAEGWGITLQRSGR